MCCLAMAGADSFGTLLTRAVAKGHARLAGWGDVGGDFFGKCLLTGYGFSTLTHGHGVRGWLWCLPVFVTGYWTTKKATQAAARIKEVDE